MKVKSSIKLQWLNKLIFLAIILFIVVIGIYFFNFNNGFSVEKSEWGAFGDFIGGTLNPMFAFLSLIAIIYTIKIQTEELEYTKEELEKSRIAQEKQSKSFQIQNNSIKQQTFENTFFRLLEHHNSLIDELYKETDELYNKIVIKGDNNKIIINFLENNKGIVKTYFMTLYQLLKFINDEEKKFLKDTISFNPKLYTNIIRATFDDALLCLLAFNCNIKDFEKFKKLIEKYNFLEHLNIEFVNEKGHELKVIDALFMFEKSIFGDNASLYEIVNSIKEERKKRGIYEEQIYTLSEYIRFEQPSHKTTPPQ